MRNRFEKPSRWLAAILCAIALGSLACNSPLRDADEGADSAVADDAQSDLLTSGKVSLPVSGDVVLIGGWGKGNKATATDEFFNPTTRKFTKTGSLKVGEGAGVAALLLGGDDIMVAGGFTGSSKFTKKTVSQSVSGMATANLETYDPTTGKFTPAMANLLTARFGATATTLVSGDVLIAGGASSSGAPMNTAEVFDPTTGETAATANNMSVPRLFHTATLLNDGTVLLAGGGTDSVGDLTATADIYTPSTNKFTATGSMSVVRAAHAAVLLTAGMPGQVLITGGVIGGSGGVTPYSAAEAYDPEQQQFNFVGFMNDDRAFHSATVLANGDVLLAGGFTEFFSTINGGKLASLFGANLDSAEIYDPNANTFTCINGTNGKGGNTCSPAMAKGRGGHSATLFTSGPLSGQVLIAGGLGATKPNSTASELNEAELFNPTGNTFTKAGNLTAARGLHAAILLP